ncbi:MAG: hypothetical protein ACLTDV_07450 [Eubacterium sp.]
MDDRRCTTYIRAQGYKTIAKAIAYAIANKPMQEVDTNKVIGRVADQAATDGNW